MSCAIHTILKMLQVVVESRNEAIDGYLYKYDYDPIAEL